MAMVSFLLVLLVIIIGVIVWLVAIFNGLVRQKNQAKNGFSQIDIQLKRRHELIPNLVNAAKGYLTHEQTTLEQVTQARNQAMQLQQALGSQGEVTDNPSELAKLAHSQNQLTQALGRLYAVIESYPELKADAIVTQLMDELTNTENRIAFARQHYNDSVMAYNNSREVFPNNLISSSFGFHPMGLLQFADKAQIDVVPVVHL